MRRNSSKVLPIIPITINLLEWQKANSLLLHNVEGQNHTLRVATGKEHIDILMPPGRGKINICNSTVEIYLHRFNLRQNRLCITTETNADMAEQGAVLTIKEFKVCADCEASMRAAVKEFNEIRTSS